MTTIMGKNLTGAAGLTIKILKDLQRRERQLETKTGIDNHKGEIASICRKLGVVRLDVFGSATRSDFRPESDIDVLVRFDRHPGEMFRRYFDLKEQLEKILGRPVDITLEDSIRNPYFREAIQQSRVRLYES